MSSSATLSNQLSVDADLPGQILDAVPSTNQVLLEQWDSAPPFSWVAARQQSAGRGRLGRRWDAPAGTALLMSVLAHLPADDQNPALASLAGAIAVRNLILEVLPGALCDLKWPNDVLIDGQKVAGVLSEHAGKTATSQVVIVGIGLNLTSPASLLKAHAATSLAENGWKPRSSLVSDGELGRLARSVAWHLKRILDRGQVVLEFSRQCSTLGRPVSARIPGGAAIEGLAEEIGPGGELVVSGRAVTAGDVTLDKAHQPAQMANLEETI